MMSSRDLGASAAVAAPPRVSHVFPDAVRAATKSVGRLHFGIIPDHAFVQAQRDEQGGFADVCCTASASHRGRQSAGSVASC